MHLRNRCCLHYPHRAGSRVCAGAGQIGHLDLNPQTKHATTNILTAKLTTLADMLLINIPTKFQTFGTAETSKIYELAPTVIEQDLSERAGAHEPLTHQYPCTPQCARIPFLKQVWTLRPTQPPAQAQPHPAIHAKHNSATHPHPWPSLDINPIQQRHIPYLHSL